MFYVYVFFDSEQKKFYIGFTKNIQRRLSEHRAGKNKTTKRYRNKRLIFVEVFVSEKDARRREMYFKTTKGRSTLRVMLNDALKEF